MLETNDCTAVEAELLQKLPGVMAGSGYVLQVDHSVSPLVEYATYRFFVEQGWNRHVLKLSNPILKVTETLLTSGAGHVRISLQQ